MRHCTRNIAGKLVEYNLVHWHNLGFEAPKSQVSGFSKANEKFSVKSSRSRSSSFANKLSNLCLFEMLEISRGPEF